MYTIADEIKNLVMEFEQLPYLFIGTGFSMRYGNAPSWDQLLEEIWLEIHGGTKGEYRRFIAKKSHELGKQYPDLEERKYILNPVIASQMESEFANRIFEDPEFEKKFFSEEEMQHILDGQLEPLKYYICRRIKDVHLNEEAYEYDELMALKQHQNKIAGVITTNYDTILEESVFPDFGVVVGQDSLLLSQTNNIFEIFKIHGSQKAPESVVITKEDYDSFNRKLKYLSAKLLTIFVEHPVIFIGYSVGDQNIRAILAEIAECLTQEQRKSLAHNLIFVNPIFDSDEEDSITSKQVDFGGVGRFSISMTELNLKDFTPLYESLSEIKSTLPVKLLRKVQDMVCKFVFTMDAPQNILVGMLSDPDVDEDKIGLYIGNAMEVSKIGFHTFELWDIIEDILFDNKPFLMHHDIRNTFNNIRTRCGNTWIPIYKYKKGLNWTDSDIDSRWHIISDLSEYRMKTSERKYVGFKPTEKSRPIYNSLGDIVTNHPNHYPQQFAHIMASIQILDIDELKQYLQECFKNSVVRDHYASGFRKLVALYDCKKYK